MNRMTNIKKFAESILFIASFFISIASFAGQTVVGIKGNQFYVNGKPTYPDRYWNNYKIEGLLINSRMVQGIFDDANPETVNSFVYPDTKKWDAERNTNEFVSNMSRWNSYGLNCFTINMQGGSPLGYSWSNCLNSGFNKDGSLNAAYLNRLDEVLKEADRLQMVVILGLFYFGQDQYLTDEKAVVNAAKNLINWLFQKGYRNVLIEIANETIDNGTYNHKILLPDRIDELISLVKGINKKGYRYLVGTSFAGLIVPTSNVVKASDFLLIHGNGGSKPEQIQELIDQTKKVDGYRVMPILNNEDDHYDFEKSTNNFTVSVKNYVSWGYFDFRFPGETDFKEGYQSVPIDWGINSKRKKAFFEKVKEITGGIENKPKLSSEWTNLLDENLSNFDKFIGVPHTSITKLPGSLKSDDGIHGIPLGLNNDPLNAFSVIKENKEPVLHITGEIFGGLSTRKSYSNYHLSVKFKWGEKKYEPRLKQIRDNGILYHSTGDFGMFWNVWMHSIEFQVQETEMGDLYILSRRHLQVPSVSGKDSVWVYTPEAKPVDFGWFLPNGVNRGRCKSMPHTEKPSGEWNTLELICFDDLSLHIVNGQVVNVIREVSDVAGENNEKYLREGKIQFQCEGAEAFYKEIKIRAITEIPDQYLKQLKSGK